MKYCLIIPDGAADYPLDALGGKTALEGAATPNMDAVAAAGVVGTVATIPPGYQPGSDVAIMSVLGYAPRKYYSGRAPLEAASMGIEMRPGDVAARCNLVTIIDGRMADYSAGHISREEAAEIMPTLNEKLGSGDLRFYPGNGYRNILMLKGAGELKVELTPPHDIAGREVAGHLPSGPDAGRFLRLMKESEAILAAHPVNERRGKAGKAVATSIWLWGQGQAARFPGFHATYGVRPAVITAVDLVAGVCALAGWERIAVAGATGYYDTDYRGKGQAAIEALDRVDLVFVHVEAPDEASHNRDACAKVRCIEEIDRHVVGPLFEALRKRGDYRVLILPDHYTTISTGGHSGEPVPFAAAGKGIAPSRAEGFNEKAAAKGLSFASGPDLMGAFLGKAKPWLL